MKTQKDIEIKNFEPKKKNPSLRVYENIRVPPPSHPRALNPFPLLRFEEKIG